MKGTGEGYEGGRDHKLGDVSGCGEDERLPRPALPPPGRGASLQFAISGVFNLGVERSAGPTFQKNAARPGGRFAETSKPTRRSEVAGKAHLQSDGLSSS